MADTFAQVTGRPALVNLHSSAGLGNALGNLVAAYHANTPLIVTSGQQHRELVIGEPYLGNREATTMPKPWVKWSYEPARAADVPEAFMRAYAMALQPPAGPVYLSIPMDDWHQPLAGPARVADGERPVRPRPGAPAAVRRPHLRQPPSRAGVRARRWTAAAGGTRRRPGGEAARRRSTGPRCLDRASFPEDHPLFRGPLGMSVKTDQRPTGRARPGRRDRRGGVPVLPLRSRRLPPGRHGAAADHRQPRGRRGRAGGRRPAGRPQDRRSTCSWTWSRTGSARTAPDADGAAAPAAVRRRTARSPRRRSTPC